MLTMQACQQHRLVVMQPTKQNRFLRRPCLRQQSWYSAAAENVGPVARRVGMLGGHTRVNKSVDDGEVEPCWESCTQHVGITKARTWVKTTWNWAKGGAYLLGKSYGGKTARTKHRAARARSRLDELTFGMLNVRTAAINGVNGIDHIDTLLRPCATKSCGVSGREETIRDGASVIVASGYRVYFNGDCSGVKGRKEQLGVELAIKKETVKKSSKDDIAIECISARLLKARISIKSNFVKFVIASAPTEEAPEGKKAKYMVALNSTVASVSTREYVFVLTDANARTREER